VPECSSRTLAATLCRSTCGKPRLRSWRWCRSLVVIRPKPATRCDEPDFDVGIVHAVTCSSPSRAPFGASGPSERVVDDVLPGPVGLAAHKFAGGSVQLDGVAVGVVATVQGERDAAEGEVAVDEPVARGEADSASEGEEPPQDASKASGPRTGSAQGRTRAPRRARRTPSAETGRRR
jgi:hypothetical protein